MTDVETVDQGATVSYFSKASRHCAVTTGDFDFDI
jgi:hypothetical protein